MIVDDSPYNLFVMEELLKTFTNMKKIMTALNGLEAIEIIQQVYANGKNFDYIFLDLHMPVMDGFQAIKNLKTMESKGEISLQHTKIIALSAITEN